MPAGQEIIKAIMGHAVEACLKKGVSLNFEKHLPPNKEDYSVREVVNAIGRSLTENGIPNNLFKPL